MRKIVFTIALVLVSFVAISKLHTIQAACDPNDTSVDGRMCNHDLWYNYSATTFKDKVFGSPATEIFGERYTLAQVNWIINSLTFQHMGAVMSCLNGQGDLTKVNTCITKAQANGGGSPLMMLAQLDEGMLNNRPASGVDYIAQKLDQLSPVKSAYAQTARSGYGFRSLQPIQNIWLAARNVSFGLMSFVIIILAFMIMLRQKISPQVVVSVQSALPKVAIALIVITFSYAIAGLLIDLAYVVMGLFSAVVATSGLVKGTPNVLEMFNNLNAPIWGFTGWIEILVAALTVASVVGFGLSASTLGAAGGVVGLASAALALILGLLLAVAFFRIFITLLKAYATSIFLVIGFPFIALLSVVSIGPGIGGWFRQFAAQLAVFVGVALVVMLSHLVFWSMSRGVTATFGDLSAGANPYHFIVNQIQGDPQFPGFGGFDTSIIGFFIGFGILFSAPKIASGLRDQVATGRGSYGFDTSGAMLGSGIPFVGGMAVGQLGRLQTGLGNTLAKIGLTQGPRLVNAVTGKGSGLTPPPATKTPGSSDSTVRAMTKKPGTSE